MFTKGAVEKEIFIAKCHDFLKLLKEFMILLLSSPVSTCVMASCVELFRSKADQRLTAKK